MYRKGKNVKSQKYLKFWSSEMLQIFEFTKVVITSFYYIRIHECHHLCLCIYSKINTTVHQSQKLYLTLDLKKKSTRLSDVATELTELHHLLLDPSSSNLQKIFTLTSIKAQIIPFICAASVKISDSTNNLSPSPEKIMFIK